MQLPHCKSHFYYNLLILTKLEMMIRTIVKNLPGSNSDKVATTRFIIEAGIEVQFKNVAETFQKSLHQCLYLQV